MARCSDLAGLEQDQCLEVCRDGALCRYSRLCGAACTQGCGDDKPLDLILQDPEQDACSVSWFLEQQTAPATFLVVGKVRAGMWRILKSGLGLERIDLSSGETERFEELSVLAVSGSGLEDARRTRLHPSHCLVYPDLPVNLLQFSKPVENWSSGSLVLLLVGLLSCALSSSALVLYCIYSWRRR